MWLGIDVGTGGSRALLVDERGRVRAGYTALHEDMHMAHPQWAEQRPENWWDAVVEAVRGVLAKAGVSGAAVKGIGLSGQMHGLVILDEAHQVIRPSLIWCDQRSQAQVDFVNAKIVRDNEPANFERVRQMLLPKDYVRFRLTGEFATEVSDASGTSVFDVVKRRWSFEMMDGLDLDRAILPRCYESSEVTGAITAEVAALTGLEAGTPVVGGGGDQAASAVGNGIVEEGIVSCTLGTSGVVFAHMEKVAYDPAGRVHTFCHAVRDKWHVMGVTQGAGLSLQWFRNQLAPGVEYDALTEEAAQSPAGAQGLFWLPYLMGERTPHLDATIRGGWIGLTARSTRADLIRAVIEGVSYSQRDCLDIIEELGVRVSDVRASGGGAKSAFWRRLLAGILNKRVVTLETQEGSAYGAALLALSGQYGSVPEMCRVAIRETEAVKPDAGEAAFYAKAHKVYQSMYPALKGICGEIAGL